MTVDLYVTLPSDFEELFQEYKDSVASSRKTMTGEPNIFYDQTTAMGSIDGIPFRLKDGSKEHKVFGRLYSRIGKKLERQDVLVAIDFYKDYQEPDPARKNAETEVINEVAKNLRKKTGLNTEQLVQNNGNLTLIGTKLRPK